MTSSAIAPAKGVYIDNAWRPAHSGRVIPVVSPPDGIVFAEIAAGGPQDIDAAVAAARKAVGDEHSPVRWLVAGVVDEVTPGTTDLEDAAA